MLAILLMLAMKQFYVFGELLGFRVQFTNPLQGMWSSVCTRGDINKAAEFDASNETILEAVPVAIKETVTSGKHKVPISSTPTVLLFS